MGKLKFLSAMEGDVTHERQYASIHCPGCGYSHAIGIGPHAHGHVWSFNGDEDKPVFQPSLLMRTYHYPEGYDAMPEDHPDKVDIKAMFAQPNGHELMYDSRFGVRCHSFIGYNGAQPGEIIFLGDCTHALAGKTVPLPDYPQPEGST